VVEVKIEMEPIGHVVSRIKNPEEMSLFCDKGINSPVISKISLKEKFRKGLEGLENFSHVFVIYFLHKEKRVELKTYPAPTRVKDLPRVGVFGSRSQCRPNHIALKLVELLEVNQNEIIVKGLDAIDGSPVLDIKPYIPSFDRPEKVRIARWYEWVRNDNRDVE